MAVFEGIHDNLLQGVSQQVPRSRLPGQLTLQENMVSDPVTGLRRRPGSVLRFTELLPEATTDSIKAWRTDIAGVSTDCVIDSNTGTLLIRESGVTHTLQSDYLKAADIRMLRHASVGESLYIGNISKTPIGTVDNTVKKDPAKTGWAYIRASALSKQFAITVKHSGGTYTGTYTTPDGTSPSHVGQTTLEYIAQKVVEDLNSKSPGVTITRDGSYIFFQAAGSNTNLSVTTNSGSTYIGVSRSNEIRDSSDLPPRLPNAANGVVTATGFAPQLVYFRYESSRERWVETSAYGSINTINNMPVEVYYDVDSTSWKIDEEPWPGRLAGDDETNPDPDFIDWGITGLASYQGRLVLLSGPWVWLSSTKNPRIFYRSTVEDLLDSDPIGVGSSSATSAAFQYAIPFNKDLVLFSNEFQALIPGGNTAITPQNVNLVVTSTYSADLTATPITLGPSLMYSIPRSRNFFGMMEMLPSPYTDSQYISQDATEHIPRYMPGRCRFSVGSSVSGVVVFGSTHDKNALYVHEYMWDGEDKVLRAWHRWSFKYPVAYAYFSGDLINILTIQNGVLVVCTVDPRSGQDPTSGSTTGYLDYSTTAMVEDIEDGEFKGFKLEDRLATFFGDDASEVSVAYCGGDLDGYELGTEPSSTTGYMRLSKAVTAITVTYGHPYESKFAPSPPMLRGQDELPITTRPMRLVKYYINTAASGEFDVSVWDTANQTPAREWTVNPVRWVSTELSLGRTPINGFTGTVIPCRTNSETSQVVFRSDGLTEFNVLSLEYVCKHTQRLRRI